MNSSMETHLIRTYWHDGLLDLLAGIGLLGIGLAWHFDLVALGAIVPAVVVVLWNPLRQRWIEPRLGHITFTASRRRESRRFLIVTALAGLAVAALVILILLWPSGAEVAPVEWVAALPAALLAVLALLAAALTRALRLVVYALLLLSLGVVVVAIRSEPELAMLVAGMALVLAGAELLRRFFRATSQSDADGGAPE